MKMRHPDNELLVVIMKSTFTDLTQEEGQLLAAWLQASPENKATYEALANSDQLHEKMACYAHYEANKHLHFQQILQQVVPTTTTRRLPISSRWLLAACVLLALAVSAWLIINRTGQSPAAPTAMRPQVTPPVVEPGKPGAVLTLSDGSQLTLDSLGQGIIAHQQGVAAELGQGQLAYHIEGNTTEPVFNMLSTPKGREFKILLPDGSAAWLNSCSSIRFPTTFATDRREVFITGEVYFEVAPQTHPITRSKLPFVVHIKTPDGHFSLVEVLGTHFNVNAYTPVAATTLLEGSVRVRQSPHTTPLTLLPGQQAQATAAGQPILTTNADLQQVMAWRRGFFNFDNATLEEVMDQLARWYDLEAEYPHGAPAIRFQGEMSRGMQLSSVLRALEESKVHFKLEGRKISILP